LLRAYRAGAQVAWRGLADAGDRAGVDPRELYTLAEAIFAYIDEISAASAEGFAREQSRAVSQLQARRQRLVDLLLREPAAEPEAIERAARDAEWKLPPRLAVLAFESERPERVASTLPVGCLVGDSEGLPVAIVPDPDGPRRRRAVERAVAEGRGGLGHSVDWADAPLSARRARLALRLTGGPDAGLVASSDHLLEMLLTRDEALMTDLARHALAPLDGLAPNRRARLVETLEAWLDAHGEARPAAERLHVHVQTVRYRLGQLRELFGDALDDPQRRLEIALAVRATQRGVRSP
jgi:hypothetical protein